MDQYTKNLPWGAKEKRLFNYHESETWWWVLAMAYAHFSVNKIIYGKEVRLDVCLRVLQCPVMKHQSDEVGWLLEGSTF